MAAICSCHEKGKPEVPQQTVVKQCLSITHWHSTTKETSGSLTVATNNRLQSVGGRGLWGHQGWIWSKIMKLIINYRKL